MELLVHYRGLEQVLHRGGLTGDADDIVIVAVLPGVEDSGKGPERRLGDLDEHGGLPARFVPEHLEVEGLEELGFELRGQGGQDVPGEGELVEQGGVGGFGGGLGESGQLGLDLLAFGVELGEPGPDPGPHRRGGGVAGVGGEFFQFEDAGVLAGLDPLEPGVQGGGAGVAFEVDDLDKMSAELRAKGIEVSEPMVFPACKIANFNDPEGNKVSLHQTTVPH